MSISLQEWRVMGNTETVNFINISLVKSGSWAFWGAKRLLEVNGICANVIEDHRENLAGTDILIVPRIDNERIESSLTNFLGSGGTLVTEAVGNGRLANLLGIQEQPARISSDKFYLHYAGKKVYLPPLIDYIHREQNPSNGCPGYYEIDGNKYLFAIERSVKDGKVVLLSSLFSLVSRTYSWSSDKLCNQELLGELYLDFLNSIFLEILIKEANLRGKALARLWHYPSCGHEAAVLVTLDIDDEYCYSKTLRRSSYGNWKHGKHSKLVSKLLWSVFAKLLSVVKYATEQRLSTKAKGNFGIRFLVRIWKGVNGKVTPNFLELLEQYGYKAVLFLRPPSIQAQEKKDSRCYQLKSYLIHEGEVRKASSDHEIGLHFGKSIISVEDVQAEEVKSYWTERIKERRVDLEEKIKTVKTCGARGHFSFFYYPDTIEQLQEAGLRWDSTFYGHQRWVSSNGNIKEVGYVAPAKSWTTSIVGTSFPFYPVIVKQEPSLEESKVLEIPVILYELGSNREAVLKSVQEVLEYGGVLNVQCHPSDMNGYIELKKLFEYLSDKHIWKTTGNELSLWWKKRMEVNLHKLWAKLDGNTLHIDLDTASDTLPLIINMPRDTDISKITRIEAKDFDVTHFTIDGKASIISMDIQRSKR